MTLVWKSGYSFDSDASTYIDAVETADGQTLETGVRIAINDFVLGCKQDGIWNAIKASCILAGARTLGGALVPLVGSAPTNNNFVSADYDRETGLVGDGSTKYLDSNRNNNVDPQDNFHASTYATTGTGTTSVYLGAGPATNEFGATNFGYNSGSPGGVFSRARCKASNLIATTATSLVGVSRNQSSTYILRTNKTSYTTNDASETPYNGNLIVFATTSGNFPTDARLAFYSIGESLDLAKLDTRVSNLITAIGAAIP